MADAADRGADDGPVSRARHLSVTAEHRGAGRHPDQVAPGEDGADQLRLEDAELDTAVAESGRREPSTRLRLRDARDADADRVVVGVVRMILDCPVLAVIHARQYFSSNRISEIWNALPRRPTVAVVASRLNVSRL